MDWNVIFCTLSLNLMLLWIFLGRSYDKTQQVLSNTKQFPFTGAKESEFIRGNYPSSSVCPRIGLFTKLLRHWCLVPVTSDRCPRPLGGVQNMSMRIIQTVTCGLDACAWLWARPAAIKSPPEGRLMWGYINRACIIHWVREWITLASRKSGLQTGRCRVESSPNRLNGRSSQTRYTPRFTVRVIGRRCPSKRVNLSHHLMCYTSSNIHGLRVICENIKAVLTAVHRKHPG